MLAHRQILTRLAIADIVLFVIAAVFNDHSSTSVDGIIWWVALAGFALLFLVACAIMLGWVWSRARHPRRARIR